MSHDNAPHIPDRFLESRYWSVERVRSRSPNPQLVNFLTDLTPGGALDLGCGEGSDARWLARRGWEVTGVDISATAIKRAQQESELLNLDTAIRFVTADLTAWLPEEGSYDLVTASFLSSPSDFPRTAILRRFANRVSSGGHLSVVSHAAPPPWLDPAKHTGHRIISPAQEFVELGLEALEWKVITAANYRRAASGPTGETMELLDGVLLIRRS